MTYYTLNEVRIIGRLTKNPELEESGETKYCKFTVVLASGDGEKSTFIDTVVFSKSAEFLAKYCYKGDLVLCCGELNVDKWEDSKGNKSKLSIVTQKIELLSKNQKERELEVI